MEPRSPARPEPVRIDITVNLHHRFRWLITGIALGALPTSDLPTYLARLVAWMIGGDH